MAYTDYFDHTTGVTLYGKARPLDTGTWGNGVISMTENGTTGEYSASTFVDNTQYVVYVQAGGSPASTDTKLGQITPGLNTSNTDLLTEARDKASIAANNTQYA